MSNYDSILNRARHYCAYQERCEKQVRDKLISLKADSGTITTIIMALNEDNYINELRFAKEFATGKFRNNHWGKVKIINELRKNDISDTNIRNAVDAIDEEEYIRQLEKLIGRKKIELQDQEPLWRKKKLLDHFKGKGYSYQDIIQVLDGTSG